MKTYLNKYYFLAMFFGALLIFSACSKDEETPAKEKEKPTEQNPLEKFKLVELVTQYRPDFMLGTHTKWTQLTAKDENVKSRAIVSTEYNMISVGFYQRATQKESQSDWEFGAIDPVTDFAQQKDLKVYAHPMFGSNGYLPDWLMDGDFTNEELLVIIEDRIKTLLTRYKGKIHMLDVYNEGFSRSSQNWRAADNKFLSLGYNENEIGKWPVFLEKILVWCRQYGGDDLKLIYNDNHNTLFNMPQSLACINLYQALKHEGIPIDGIGIQCHTKISAEGKHLLSAAAESGTSAGVAFDPDLFAKNLKSFGDAGIDVHISESDVHLYGTIDAAKLAMQARAYSYMLKTCLEAPACKSYKTWGFTDASCWKPMKSREGYSDYEPYPLPFDHSLNPKPAYMAMKDMVISLIDESNE